MDIYKETQAPLAHLWNDNQARQGAKIVLMQAIANVTDISAKQADEILDELDRMLLNEEEDAPKRQEKGL